MDEATSGRALERAGRALRRLRERRHLSLEAAADLTASHREPLNKSYLFRLESGQVSPTVSRLTALAGAYGVSTRALVEMFDLEERLATVPVASGELNRDDARVQLDQNIASGRYLEALALAQAESGGGDDEVRRALARVDCLLHLDAYELAKSEALRALEMPGLTVADRVAALYLASAACSHLKLFTAAFALLEKAERTADEESAPARWIAFLHQLRGLLHFRTGGFADSARASGEAMQQFEKLAESHESCRSAINMAGAFVELGEIDLALGHLQSAVRQAEGTGSRRLVALALCTTAVAQFRKGVLREARASALRSNEIAQELGYTEVVFRNTFYLAEVARRSGDRTSLLMYERTLRHLHHDVDPESPEAEEVRNRIATGGNGEPSGGGA